MTRALRVCGASIEVITYLPSGETWDMKPNRFCDLSSEKELHWRT